MCENCDKVPIKFQHPIWKYDIRKVAGRECLLCRGRIGKRPYVHIDMLARFGQMLFAHMSCEKKVKEKKHERNTQRKD